MNNKTIFKYIVVFCWFVLIPLIFFLNANFNFFPEITFIPPPLFILLFRISILFWIIFLFTFLFLFFRSLIKLNYYKKNKEKEIYYKQKLIQYFIFLLILVCGLLLNNWYGKITGIEIGGECGGIHCSN